MRGGEACGDEGGHGRHWRRLWQMGTSKQAKERAGGGEDVLETGRNEDRKMVLLVSVHMDM